MSCSCNDCTDITLFSGNDGKNGIFGGYSSKWKFNTDTNVLVIPLSGYLKVNNLSLLGVTKIQLNNIDANIVDVAAFLTSFNASGDFGLVRLFKETDSSTFFMGRISGVTTGGTGTGAYHELDVIWTVSNGTFTSEDSVVISYTPIGTVEEEGELGSANPQTVNSLTYSVPPSYNLIKTNTSATLTKKYKIDVSFQCGDVTGLAPFARTAGMNLKCGLFQGGVLIWESFSHFQNDAATSNWGNTIPYQINDIVLSGADYYKSLTVHTGSIPPSVNWVIQEGVKKRGGGSFVREVTLAPGEAAEVKFAAISGSVENGRLQAATFYYRET